MELSELIRLNNNSVALVLAFVLLAILAYWGAAQAQLELAKVQDIALNLMKSVADKPYCGENPIEGKVYEGWFVDVGDSGYYHSLGKFLPGKGGGRALTVTNILGMVNPYAYSQLLVTEEPVQDPNPIPE
jgi:hypothetical protein